MTTTMIPPRWYMLDRIGQAMLCNNQKDAEHEARVADRDFFPGFAPHIAVQLAPVVPLREVTDADVTAAMAAFFPDRNTGDGVRAMLESFRARLIETPTKASE